MAVPSRGFLRENREMSGQAASTLGLLCAEKG